MFFMFLLTELNLLNPSWFLFGGRGYCQCITVFKFTIKEFELRLCPFSTGYGYNRKIRPSRVFSVFEEGSKHYLRKTSYWCSTECMLCCYKH